MIALLRTKIEILNNDHLSESTKDEIIGILDKYLVIESSISGYLAQFNMGESEPVAKYIRMVDVARSKLKRKAITEKEFDENFKKIKDKAKADESLSEFEVAIIRKSGSEQPNLKYARPNKNRSSMKPEDFGEPGHPYRRNNSVDEVTAEKIDRHLGICSTTDDYNEYQQHYKALMKIIGANPKATIMAGVETPNRYIGDKNRIAIRVADANTSKKISSKDRELYHTTTVEGIKRLIPRFRSKHDTALYPEKRVYFHADKAGSRLGGSANGTEKPAYLYAGKTKTAKPDPELNSRGEGSAFYIASKDSLPVKQIQSAKKKN